MKQLIFVLGSQRSGTNVLRQSLSLDPYVMGFNEVKNSELYSNWFLRPEPEIRGFLLKQPQTVLIKPIKSVINQPVKSFLSGFSGYDLKVAWIYRHPVNVFYSRRKRWPYLKDVNKFIDEWNRINQSAMKAKFRRMRIARYEDICDQKAVFSKLCKFLDVKGEHLFKSGHNSGFDKMGEKVIARIEDGTKETFANLKKLSLK